MLSALNNMRIQQKLTITFGAMVVAIVAMGGCVFWGINGLETARREVVEAAAVQNAARDAQLHMSRQDAALRAYVMSRNPAGIDAVSEHRRSFNESLNTVLTLKPELEGKVEEARAGVEKWFEAVAVRGVGLTDMADYDNAALLEPVNATLTAMVEAESAEVRLMAEKQQSLTTMVQVAMIGGTLIALLMAVLSGLWLTRGVAMPLGAVASGMRRLVGGDTSVEVVGADRKDEVGQMAAAVAHFKVTTLEKQAAEARNAALQKQTDDERAAQEALRAEEQRQDLIAIAALSDGLENLAQGNLTWRFDVEVVAKAQNLKDNFNVAMQRLEKAVMLVNNNASTIYTGVREISSASDDLSRRTEQQAATLEQTAAALEQITVTVARTAEGALEAAQVVTDARNDAAQSGGVVTSAVEAMTAIEDSSRRIGAIIGVIDEIAFQTNLLALNAGVEAARAGDAGRGFAVVASEVRALAQRSADAAKEIKALILAAGQQVGQGVTLVGQTGDALKRIVGRVSEIDALVNEIAASAQEQASGLGQVNVAVNHMDQVTQQNAAMVEETTAAARSLSSEADALAASVAHFTVAQTLAKPAHIDKAKPAAVSSYALPAARKAPLPEVAPLASPERMAPVVASPEAKAPVRNVVNEMRAKLAEAVARNEIVAPDPVKAPAAKPLRPANEGASTPERSRSVAETMAALKTSGRGGTALKSQPIEDGWEEF